MGVKAVMKMTIYETLFTTPQIRQIVVNNQVFDEVIMTDSEGAWNVGEPNLPAYSVSLLLPQGTTIADITIEPGTKIC